MGLFSTTLADDIREISELTFRVAAFYEVRRKFFRGECIDEAMPLVIDGLHDPNEFVRQTCRTILVNLPGRYREEIAFSIALMDDPEEAEAARKDLLEFAVCLDELGFDEVESNFRESIRIRDSIYSLEKLVDSGDPKAATLVVRVAGEVDMSKLKPCLLRALENDATAESASLAIHKSILGNVDYLDQADNLAFLLGRRRKIALHGISICRALVERGADPEPWMPGIRRILEMGDDELRLAAVGVLKEIALERDLSNLLPSVRLDYLDAKGNVIIDLYVNSLENPESRERTIEVLLEELQSDNIQRRARASSAFTRASKRVDLGCVMDRLRKLKDPRDTSTVSELYIKLSRNTGKKKLKLGQGL